MYVAGHPDNNAQAQRLANTLKVAAIPTTLYGASESTHDKINNDIGLPEDPGTRLLKSFLSKALEK